MSRLEIRASLSLASLFALRMLGLFLILPVFAVHAHGLAGGDNHVLVGLALGVYGLTQGFLQIPFGMASDRYGRKRVIVCGFLLFAAGSFVAAVSDNLYMAIIGRAIQGAGAISAAIVAFAADLTREEHRTKAMAIIGSSIGFMFALSLVAAPLLYARIGMQGIFVVTGVLALAGIAVVLKVVPSEPHAVPLDPARRVESASFAAVIRDKELLRLNFGIFALHAMQMAVFVVVPLAIVRHGLPLASHWKIYLPVVLISFVLMVPPILAAERRGWVKQIFVGSIVLMLAVQLGLWLWSDRLGALAAWLLAFFVAFNVLEASLPSLVSRFAPAAARGTALGVYNTTQSLGLFAGGAISGALMQRFGASSVFMFGLVLAALWLWVAAPMQAPRRASGLKSELVGEKAYGLGE